MTMYMYIQHKLFKTEYEKKIPKKHETKLKTLIFLDVSSKNIDEHVT